MPASNKKYEKLTKTSIDMNRYSSQIDEPNPNKNEMESNKTKIYISIIYFDSNGDEQRTNRYYIRITYKENVLLENSCDISENVSGSINAQLEVDFGNIEELIDLIDNPILVYVSESVLKGKGKPPPNLIKLQDGTLLVPLGYCNMDLYPLILGEDFIEEALFIQPLKIISHLDMTTYPNLSKLMLRASIERNDKFDYNVTKNLNIISVTMEGLFNVPKEIKTDCECSIYTFLPKGSDESQVYDFLFKNGKKITYLDIETLKKWATLDNIEGRGNMSTFQLSKVAPINKYNITLQQNPDIEIHCIMWNSMHRLIISQNDCDNIKNFIDEKNNLVVEFFINKSSSSAKPNSQKKEATINYPIHLMAFPDISRLLYPGECSVRVATPVYIFNQDYFSAKGGIKSNFSVTNELIIKKPTEDKQDDSTTDEQQEEFYNEAGEPVYIIIEVNLSQSLTKHKALEDIYEDIHKLIPIREIDEVLKKAQDVKRRYHQTIKESVTLLQEGYTKFQQSGKSFSFEVAGDDDMSGFLRYLQMSGLYSDIMKALTSSVSLLIENNYKVGDPITSEDEFQLFISKAYVELIKEMHKVVKEKKPKVFAPIIPGKDLLNAAREEEALKHFENAERLHLQRISLKKDDEQVWFDLTVHYMTVGKYEEAFVTLNECLQLNFRHILGLILCGAILMYKSQFSDAENFFLAVMTIYPKFFEGFIASSFFYKKIEKFESADCVLDIAKSIVSDNIQCICSNINCTCNRDVFMLQDELIWYDTTIPKKKIFLRAAALFIRLRLYEFAEAILGEELIESGPSFLYSYLLATVHYYQGNYEDALKHMRDDGYDSTSFLASSLEGHCLDAINQTEAAVELFEYTNLCFERPNDIHLVYIKLGYYYLDIKNYLSAKKIFITCCNYSPTPNSWLGAGIAFMEMKLYDDCEKCLTEANFLDRHNANVWAYLTILNIHLSKTKEFKKCFAMAMKNGLSDENLLKKIENLCVENLAEEFLRIKSNSLIF